jgi:two-component system chemotaxis sensor kinase CheA
VHDGSLYVAQAIVREGTTLGYARSSVPMAEVERYGDSVRQRIALGSALALLAAMAVGLLLSSRIVRPVQRLSEGARRVGEGDFEHTIAVSTNDEIGDLAASFNEMTSSLRDAMQVLDGRNRDMRLVLDNVGQGLLTIDRAGTVSTERSAAVDAWFGVGEPGMHFVTLLGRFDPRAASSFELQWEEVIEGLLPLAVNIDQLPKRALRGEQELELSYTPILDESKKVSKMLVVISDVTARRAAERAEAEQREVACIFEHMMRDKAGVLEFLLDAETQVAVLTSPVRAPSVEIKRRLHTLKGNSAVYGMQRLSVLCHHIESRMEATETDLSVEDREVLAHAWARMSERLSAFVGDSKQVVIDDEEYATAVKALLEGCPRAQVARMVRDWRLERASDRLGRFAANARELALRLGKGDLRVQVPRSTLRLPRERWAPFWGAFSHVVRNAVDHGLEGEVERRETGKDSPPTLRFTASEGESEILIEVADNGRGVDWERVADRARRLGLPSKSRADLVAALFADGVSTRDEVTEVSGRGVGLAAVKEACEGMGGRVQVESERGKGTTFSFHVPRRLGENSFPPPVESLRPVARVG